jgi:serine/threonine protein kinase
MQNQRTKAEQQLHKAKLANSYQQLLNQFESKELTHVGNYTVGRLVGKGSFGKVYLARNDLINGSKVVLKSSSKEDHNLAKEVHWHRQFVHPHIARLYEVVVTELNVYLVLEYCPGNELYDHICRHGPLPVEKAQKIFTQLVGAVSYIHSKSCVHRDLKLENVLLDKRDNVKLIDFGFTREYEGKASYLQTFCGTICYSAPEMLKGEKYAAEKVDIWSLGVILYALLKGELPFDEDDDIATKAKILKEEPNYPDTFPEGAVTLLSKLLAKRPFHRPSLADVLADPFLATEAPAQQAILKLAQPAPFSTEIEKQTLERMKAAGVDIDKVIESVLSQRCDSLAGWWTLLYEKEQRKEIRREKKRREREAELKLLRRLSGASGRFSNAQPTLPEVDEEARPESQPTGLRTRSNSRGRRNRRSTPQILVSDLPQLPEGSPMRSPGTMTPPKPIDKDSLRSRSTSRTRAPRPPLPPKGTSREWKRRSSNLQLVTSNSEILGPVNGVNKRGGIRTGRLRRNNQFLNQLSALKHWFVESTKRAKSPLGKPMSSGSGSQKSPASAKFGLTTDKARSQPHLSLHQPLTPGERPTHDRATSGASTVLTRNSSYGNTLTPVTSANQLNGVHKLDISRATNHQKSGSNATRTSLSPSPMTPRGSQSRRLSSGAGLRGRKSTSSSVSSIRSMPRHAGHSKASSQSSNSLDTIHSPAGSRTSSMQHHSRSPHTSLKVLPAGPVFSSTGRLVRSSDGGLAAPGGTAPVSKFNEAMIGSSSGGVMFARRKKSAFKGPGLNAGLFGQSIGQPMGSPAVFGRNREGSDGSTNKLFGRRKNGATGGVGHAVAGAGAMAGATGAMSLGIPEEEDSGVGGGKRKSVIVEEDEEEAEMEQAYGNGVLEEEEEDVEEVDAFDEPVLQRGERLDSITFIDGPAPFFRKASGGERPPMERVSSQAIVLSPSETPLETPKISIDGRSAPQSPGGFSESESQHEIGVGQSASTPRLDLGREWGK